MCPALPGVQTDQSCDRGSLVLLSTLHVQHALHVMHSSSHSSSPATAHADELCAVQRVLLCCLAFHRVDELDGVLCRVASSCTTPEHLALFPGRRCSLRWPSKPCLAFRSVTGLHSPVYRACHKCLSTCTHLRLSWGIGPEQGPRQAGSGAPG